MAGQHVDTVLIVDDDAAKRHAVGKILRRAGYEVKHAETGAEGLRMAAELPSLIVLDVKLPDVSGFEVCRRIKEDPATAAIPVLHLSTTFVEMEDRVYGLEGGADGYLTDVLEPIELIATVKALLRARRAEEAAHITSNQWQVTFDAISDGVILLDVNGNAVQCNAAMEGFLGQTWSLISGRSIHDILPIPPTPEESPFLRMLQTGRREAVELTGGELWLRVTVDPIRDANRVVKGGLCIASDVTERIRLEKELRKRADELVAADQRKDEFLAMLAHELRNPLAPISNALEILRRIPDGRLAKEALNIAERQVKHMSRLLDDLLDVARFTRGNIQLRMQTVDLTAIVKQAVETARPVIEAGAHSFSAEFAPVQLWLEGDSTRLAQVIANLLNNAAKYTDPGGAISLEVAQQGEEAVIQVADSGVGLDAQMISRVFDLFAQEDRSLARSQGGLGIGLTLVRSLVQMHGGSVTAESEGKGRGSRFTVRLPLITSPVSLSESSPSPLAQATPQAVTPLNLLVVDDSRDSAATLAQCLDIWGFKRVSVAHDGPEAIEIASSNPLDVILLDIGLPGMDGYQVAARLRTLLGSEGPILIALTGYGQMEDVAKSRSVGFDDHLVKPVDLDRLKLLLSDPGISAARASRNAARGNG